MSLQDNPRCIWVAPGEDSEGEGTFANPFHSFAKALDCAAPGQTIVLAKGTYEGDVTIKKSGTIDMPLRIIAEEPGAVIWIGSCWYFYDVSDVICSDIVFKESPGMAVSVVGKCCRNSFNTLTFIDCGESPKESCTFFFGGSGQSCNIIETCRFIRQAQPAVSAIGILVSEGDIQGDLPNCNVIVNNTTIENYSYGILVGTQGTVAGDYGHQITNNTIRNCLTEGIMIKCGDTLVSGNTLVNCPGTAISVVAGSDSVIESNRIVDAGTGIRVTGNGHSITNNCIVRCRENALQVFFESETETPLQGALFIENNTCVDWGIGDGTAIFGGICIVSVITCIVRNNLLYGAGNPVAFAEGFTGKSTHFVDDNIVAGGCGVVQGFRSEEVVFASPATDDYTSQLRYGAQGWVLSPDNAGRDMRSTFAAALPDLEDDDRHEESDTDFVNTGDAPDVFNALYSWFDNPESDNDLGNRTVDNGTMSADDESEYVD